MTWRAIAISAVPYFAVWGAEQVLVIDEGRALMIALSIGCVTVNRMRHHQGLTLVHVRAQLEHIRDTFMGQVGLCGAERQLKFS